MFLLMVRLRKTKNTVPVVSRSIESCGQSWLVKEWGLDLTS